MADEDRIRTLAKQHGYTGPLHGRGWEEVARDWLIEKGHFSPLDDVSVDDAFQIIRRDYYSDVKDLGDQLIAQAKAGEIDDFEDALHEMVDGTQRVIYTRQAVLGVAASDNSDAFEDERVELDWDTGIPWSQIMFFALRADILQYLDGQGFEPGDPDSWEEDEDEDEDEDEEADDE